MLFEAGAAEVHVRISSPPVVSPCFYGIDMADEDELAAAHRSVEEMREQIGATSLAYLSLEGMQWATRLPRGPSAAPASRASTRHACPTSGTPRSSASSRPARGPEQALAVTLGSGRRRAVADPAGLDREAHLAGAHAGVRRPGEPLHDRAVVVDRALTRRLVIVSEGGLRRVRRRDRLTATERADRQPSNDSSASFANSADERREVAAAHRLVERGQVAARESAAQRAVSIDSG